MSINGYPVDAPRQFYRWRNYQVAYYTAGAGSPILLIHSINAAASSFEMRRPFAALRSDHQVFALDFLGFGGSDHPRRAYNANDYIDLIGDFARDVVGKGATVIASSLGAAYTIRAAARHPGLFGPLTLICPTGIRNLAQPQRRGWSYEVLASPLGDLIFRALASRPSIAYFLRTQSYYDPSMVDDHLIEGFYRAAYQAGAKWAPICFLTGLLNCDVREAFAQLHQPILLVWGRHADLTPLRSADAFLARNPRARLAVVDKARLSVQDERPAEFMHLVKEFLAANRSQSV
ncbi:alpha/beta fold hydrolase [Roseiflexus sp.]|uniref:alpha/beta fold hydrolase n=1 Tax=Roseiflexus sp. TaxID=2562120 RepID=UPI0021DBD763|nr:alpha/beta fold hydrolase [Roseiflexus sp.]GIW03051.1 MAG: alpha/beta hydrolase [Roseiflexus sp.]